LTVLERLASSQGRRDETPNQDLAIELVNSSNESEIIKLVENLTNENNRIQSDCIKVLYEIGERNPNLISGYCGEFGELLSNKNSRLVWGAMTALDSIASVNPGGVYNILPQIIRAADGESVIARDHAIGVLTKLGAFKIYEKKVLPLLLAQLRSCPDNQLPMYAEMSESLFHGQSEKEHIKILSSRIRNLEKDSQRKRVQKVLKKFE